MPITVADMNRMDRESEVRAVIAVLSECDGYLAQGRAAMQAARNQVATRLAQAEFKALVEAAKANMDAPAVVELDTRIAAMLAKAEK